MPKAMHGCCCFRSRKKVAPVSIIKIPISPTESMAVLSFAEEEEEEDNGSPVASKEQERKAKAQKLNQMWQARGRLGGPRDSAAHLAKVKSFELGKRIFEVARASVRVDQVHDIDFM